MSGSLQNHDSNENEKTRQKQLGFEVFATRKNSLKGSLDFVSCIVKFFHYMTTICINSIIVFVVAV